MTATHIQPMHEEELDFTVSGKTLREIYGKLCGMLSVSGPRSMRVTTDSGAEICCSLYEGESYIKTSNGRTIYKS